MKRGKLRMKKGIYKRVLAMCLIVAMLCSMLPANMVFAVSETLAVVTELSSGGEKTDLPHEAVRTTEEGDSVADADLDLLTPSTEGIGEKMPKVSEIPTCSCVGLCTADEQNADCPVCKDGFEKCTFVEIKESAKYTEIMEKTTQLLAWIDGRMTLEGSSGYIITAEDKKYVLDGYDKIIKLMDVLAENDFPTYERLTEQEDFRRLHQIVQVIGGYATDMQLIDPFVSKGWDGYQTWNLYGNSHDVTIAGSADWTQINYSNKIFSFQTANVAGTEMNAQGSAGGNTNFAGDAKSGSILTLYGGRGDSNGETAGKITMNSGIVGNIYGGASARTIIGDIDVTINGGTALSVNAGGVMINPSQTAYVTVNGGNIDNVYGSRSDNGTNSVVAARGGNIGNVYGRNMGTGNSTVTISGAVKISGNVYGYNESSATSGKTTFNISGGEMGSVKAGGGTSNVFAISGGIIRDSVEGTPQALDTVNISGNPQIGGAGTSKGVNLNMFLGNKVNITGNLNPSARINLIPHANAQQGTVLATASAGVIFSADNFTVSNGLTCYKDGQNIKYGVTPPYISGAKIYGNGAALLAVQGSNGAGFTTVYWDKNRNGTLENGEPSLAEIGIAGAPSNNADLSAWIVYGGGSAFTKGDTQITMTGGKLQAICGNSNNTVLTGNTHINISGSAVVGDVNGNADDYYTGSQLNGNTYINISGNAQLVPISGIQYYGRVTAGGGIVNGSTNVTIGANAKVDWITGASLIATPVAGNVDVTGNASITITGGTVANIVGTRAVSGGPCTINGNLTVNASGGTIQSIDALDADKIKGTKTVNLSGSPKIGNKADRGINLSGLTNNKVIITGALTGSAGDITLIRPSSTEEGTILATSITAGNTNAEKFVLSGKALVADGSNIKITTNEPFFDGNDLFACGQPVLLMKESDDTISAYWDKNSNSKQDTGDTLIAKAETTGAAELWNIYGGRKKISMKATEGSQITLLCGGFASVNGGSKASGDIAANAGINRIVRIGTAETNTSEPAGFNSMQYKVTFDAQGSSYATSFVWQAKGQPLAEPSPAAPTKDGFTFMGFYDAKIGGKQYYRESMKAAIPTFTSSAPVILYAKWSMSTGIFAGRYSHYQVFDCKRNPAYPASNESFHVFGFAPPFDDVKDGGYQMSANAVKDKTFYFKPTGDIGKPFILYMADDVDGTRERAISRSGNIFALGKEGLLFVSQGSDKGYFISLSQGFNYGDEVTYQPSDGGPISENTASNHPDISPTPWDPNECYAVVFNSSGADTLAMPSQISVHKSPAPAKMGYLPSIPVKAGFRFDGWYTKKDGTGSQITINTVLSDNITAYAKWVSNVEYLNVTLSGSSTNLMPSAQFGTGKGVKGAVWTGVVLAKSGYNLPGSIDIKVGNSKLENGYTYSSATGEITISAAKMTDNVEITIIAKPISYTVKYHANGAVGTPSMTEQVITFDMPANAADIGDMSTAPNGWVFKGWARTGDAAGAEYAPGEQIGTANPVTLTDRATVTLYAVWDAIDANVTLQNGSFENPVITGGTPWPNFKNGTPGLEWKTTAKDGMHELVRPSINLNSAFSAFHTRAASEGSQFAELNANHVGALYQEVQSIPGSTLYWGADHRGRGGVDTMQIWIGAPKDITTALDQYIKGGNKVSAVNKVLLAKIKQKECKSDNKAWINYEGEYTVPAGQSITTFAFVSAGSSNGSASYGNLLDNIYFSFVKPPRRAGVTVRTTIGGSVTISDGSMANIMLDQPNTEYVRSLEYGNTLWLGVQAKDGYSFNGGYINGVLYHTKEDFLTASNNMHWTVDQNLPADITVLFSKNSTIIFNAQGGSYPKSEVTLQAGGADTGTEVLLAPTKQDFKFKGWLIAGGNTVLQADDSISYITSKTGAVTLEANTRTGKLEYPTTNGLILIAQWDYDDSFLKEVTLKLDYDDGTTAAATKKLNAADPSFTLPEPVSTENRFTGWLYPMGEADTIYSSGTVSRFEQNGSRPRVSIGADINVALPEMLMIAQWEPKQSTGIVIKDKPKVSYEYGESFDPTRLKITLYYDNKTAKDIPYAGNEDKFTFAPSTSGKLTISDGKVVISYTEDGKTHICDLPITVLPKTVTAAVANVESKPYDGSTTATGGKITLTGVITGEIVTVDGSFAFLDQNVGENKSVNVTDMVLNGKDAGNYRLASASLTGQSTTAGITPKAVKIVWSGSTGLIYSGAAQNVTAAVHGGELVAGDTCRVTVTDGSKQNAGTYSAVAALNNSNYVISGSNVQAYTIAPAYLTATYLGDSISFGGSPALTVNVTGFVGGETAENVGTGNSYNVPAVGGSIPTAVGVHPLTPSGGSASNYAFNYVGGNLVISRASMTAGISAADKTVTYDGGMHGIIINLADKAIGAAVAYRTTATGEYGLTENPTFKNVGIYTVYYKVTKTGYNDVTGLAQVIISQKSISVNTVSVNSKEYDGSTSTTGGRITLSGVAPGDIVTAGGGRIAFADKNTGINKNVNVNGITLSGADAGNYILADTALTSQLTAASITAKKVLLTWHNTTKTYDGAAAGVYVTASGIVAGDVCNAAVSGGSKTNAGTHTAKAALDNPNYTVSGSETNQYTINKAMLTATYEDATLVYKNTVPESAKRVSVTGFVNGESAADVGVGNSYTAPTVTIPGTQGVFEVSITPSGGSATNYDFTNVSGIFNVIDRSFDAVLIQQYLGDYDGQSHGLTVENTDTIASGAIIRYYATKADADADTTGSGSTTPITRTNAGNSKVFFKISANNFITQTGNGTITINKKKVTPSVAAGSSPTREYNGTTDVLGQTKIQLDGLVSGETLNITGTRNCTDKNTGTGKTVQTGTLVLADAGSNAANYELTGKTATAAIPTVSITQKQLRLIWSGHTGLIYTGTAKNVTASIPKEAIEAGDSCVVSTIGGNGVKAGSGFTAAAVLSNENYTASNLTQGYDISKKVLTARFKDETLAYGNLPGLKITVDGFANSENAISASGYTAPVINGVIPTSVGSHTISLKGGTADNYSFTLGKGTLTITPADMLDEVKAEDYTGIYDSANHGINVDMPAGAAITYGTAAGTYEPYNAAKHTLTDVGSKTIFYKVTKEHYQDVTGSAQIVLTKKALVPGLKPGSISDKIYDGNRSSIGGVLLLEGIVGSDAVTASGTIEFADKDAGKNKAVNVTGIILSGTKSGNYSLSYNVLMGAATNANITQKVAALNWTGHKGLIYDGTAKTVTATVGNLESGDNCTAYLSGSTATLPGSYTAAATALSNTNYKLPLDPKQSYVIAKAVITGINVIPTEKLFDNIRVDGVKVTGTREGDKLWYSTDSGSTWTDKIPQIGYVGETQITVKIEREYHEPHTIGPVTAKVKSAPNVHVGKPIFDKKNINKVTVSGEVRAGDYEIVRQRFEIRKKNTSKWTALAAGTTTGSLTAYSEVLTKLKADTEYELRLLAADSKGETVSDTLCFRTQPKNPPTGAIEGSVAGSGSITVTIEMGNTVVATQAGLSSGDQFSFKNLPDGEYNLVATDKDYRITKMVTVKDGKTTTLGVIVIGTKQSTVQVKDDAPPVAADGLNELFGTKTYTDVPEAVAAVQSGGTVEMRLTAAKAVNQGEIADIKACIGSDTLGLTVDLTVDMIITPLNELSNIINLKTVENLLTVAIPLPNDAIGKNGYRVYRHHNGVQELTLLKSGDTPTEGSFIISGGYAYIYTSKFSTYAITYAANSGSVSSYQYYTINLDAGKGGRISPKKDQVRVREGDSKGFDIIPDAGYKIADVKVDGKSIGAVSAHLFRNVRENHKISAAFEQQAAPTPFDQSPSGETGGSKAPSNLPKLTDNKPDTENTSGSEAGDEVPEQTGQLEETKQDALSDLAQKRDEAIANLPDSLTPEQLQDALDAINNIYKEAEKAILEADLASKISDLYNQAVYDFDDVLKEAGSELPSVIPTGRPFILVSAILAFLSMLLAVLSLRRRKKEEKNVDKRRKRSGIITAAGVVGAVLTFLFTTGWSGIAFANTGTLLVAVFTAIAAYFSLKNDKQEFDNQDAV